MAKEFWFPFEPMVWLTDPELRRCSKRARSTWMDIICVMHSCEVQGVLRTGTRAWSLEEIAASVPGDTAENLEDIAELLTKGAASKEDGTGALLCRMMYRRWQKRQQCSEAGKKGGGNPVFKRNPKHPPKHNHKHLSSYGCSSSSVSSGEEVQEKPKPKGGKSAQRVSAEDIERIYDAYPRKAARGYALKAIEKALAMLATRPDAADDPVSWLLERVRTYAKSRAGQDPQFTPMPATWMNGQRFDDEPCQWEKPSSRAIQEAELAELFEEKT